MTPVGKIDNPPWQRDHAPLDRFLEQVAIRYPDVTIRLVGGAVRESLLGRFSPELDDLDFAVNVSPGKMISICESFGVKVIPTGVKFGTVTCFIQGISYEFTSLRKDIHNDGRHPVVEYTNSWESDAQRRDLTINALYADWDGSYYDPTELGLKDLDNQYLRFIGDPSQRICEDYLRILRFIRFMGLFESPRADKKSLSACIQYQSSIFDKIPNERTWLETKKIFRSRYADNVFSTVMTMGLWNLKNSVYSSMELIQRTIPWVMGFFNKDPYYAWLSGNESFQADRAFSMPWTLQLRLEKAYKAEVSVEEFKLVDVYSFGKEVYKDAYLRAQMRCLDFTPGNVKIVQERLQAVDDLDLPKLPISGDDLLVLGMSPGPELGEVLNKIEEKWILRDFSLSKKECLDYASEIISDLGRKE